MSTHSSSVIHLCIPVTREIAELYISNGRVMPVEVFPEQLRAALGLDEPDPRERFTPLDTLIARVVDDHGPVQASEIARLLEDEHEHITDAGSIRKRFMKDMPLKAAGYLSTPRGYTATEQGRD